MMSHEVADQIFRPLLATLWSPWFAPQASAQGAGTRIQSQNSTVYCGGRTGWCSNTTFPHWAIWCRTGSVLICILEIVMLYVAVFTRMFIHIHLLGISELERIYWISVLEIFWDVLRLFRTALQVCEALEVIKHTFGDMKMLICVWSRVGDCLVTLTVLWVFSEMTWGNPWEDPNSRIEFMAQLTCSGQNLHVG